MSDKTQNLQGGSSQNSKASYEGLFFVPVARASVTTQKESMLTWCARPHWLGAARMHHHEKASDIDMHE